MNRNQALPNDLFEAVRASIRGMKYRAKTRTTRWGALPDFIIVGAQRAGTTSLYSYLIQHPQVLRASEKEVHYFDLGYERGIDWYRSHFPIAKPGRQHFITGEASPYYLFHPHCAERIQRLVPNVKLIFLLRNPAKRAISHYFHEVKLGWEPLSIQEALDSEEGRIEPALTKMRQDLRYHSPACQHFSYKRRGLYLEQLKPYLNAFHPNQVMVLQSEDLFAKAETTLENVFDFLGIDARFKPRDLRQKNKAHYSAKVPDLTYKSLVNYFAPANAQLCKHLNRNFDW